MKKMIKTLIVGTATVGLASVALATPELYVSSTGLAGSWTEVPATTVAPGQITWSGPVGTWNVNVDTGESYTSLGTRYSPAEDLAIQATTLTGGHLFVAFVDNGFMNTAGSLNAMFSGHAVTGTETYAFTTFGNTSDALPDATGSGGIPPTSGSAYTITSLFGTLPALVNGSGAASAFVPGSPGQTFGEVIEVSSTGGSSTSVDGSFTIPDGGASVMMFGSALSALALFKRKVIA